MGAIEIDFVDEHDRGRILGRFLEHLAQALFALAITRAHDLGPIDGDEGRVAFVGNRLGEPGLAGSWRAVEQHSLGRIDPQAGEQFGIAQRQLDHLAQLLDGVADPADVVVVHHRAAIARLLEFRAQLDLGVLVDADDALGRGRHHRQANLGERVCRCVEHPAHFGRHVLDGLLAGGGDHVARDQRFAEEIALQRLGRPLQPHLALCGREHHAGGGARFGAADGNVFARAGLGVAALQPVEPDDFERLVFLVRLDRDRGGGALAGDLDHVAFGDTERLERAARHAGDALAAFFLPRGRDLQPDGLVVCRALRVLVGHGTGPSLSLTCCRGCPFPLS